MRLGACLLFPVLAWAQPALPSAGAVMLDAAGPCFAPEGPFETLVAKVEDYGWTATRNPGDALIEDLAWIHAVFYFNGDTGGESVDNILDIQRKAALGFLRKEDIEQSKSRFFQTQSGDGAETLMVAWRKPQDNVLQVDCRYSFRAKDGASEHTEVTRAFFRSEQKRFGDTRVQVSFFDDAMWHGHSPPAYVIHTEHMKVSK